MDNGLISRKAVLSLPRNTTRNFFGEIVEESIDVADIERLPSVQPYTDEEIQAMQDLEQAQLDKAYQIGVEEGLQSAQPEQTDCEYCHEDSDGYVKPIEKNNHAFVRFGMDGWELDLTANGWHGRAKIRYCPMCGRDLLVK